MAFIIFLPFSVSGILNLLYSGRFESVFLLLFAVVQLL
jgi:hypothetical protein